MLFFLRAWRLRPQHDAVNAEVDDLIFLYGVNAYEEARRRRAQANDVSAARHWSAVKSEIGRRIVEVCGATGDLESLESRLTDAGAFASAIWDPPAENRAEARRLAARIESVQAAPEAGHERKPTPRLAAAPQPIVFRRRRMEMLLPWKDRAHTHEARCDA